MNTNNASPSTESPDNTPSIDDVLGTGTGTNRQANPEPNKPDDEGNKGDEDGKPKSSGESNPSGGDEDSPEGKVRNLFTSLSNDDLDEDQTTLRDKLLTKFKGTSFNKNGDVLDADGNVIKTFEDAYNDIASEEDGEDKYDDKGNLIDADGKVLKTKAELDAEKSFVNKLHQNLGVEIKDENGNLKSYPDDEEGLKAFTEDVANAKLEEFKQSFFSQNPLLAEVSKHILSGGKLDDFKQDVDYSKVNTKELSDSAKLNYIRDSYKAKGFSDERIERQLQLIKDGNQIDDELGFALEDLNQHQSDVKAQRQAQYEAQIAEQEAEREAYFNDVQNTIKKGDLLGINVPDKDKGAFFDYLAKPVKNGYSQASLDRAKEDMPNKLLFEYLRFKGYDLNTLVNSKVKTSKVEGLRKLIAESAKLKDADFTGKKSGGSNTKSPEVVSMDDLLPS